MGWNPFEWFADSVINTAENTAETVGGAFSSDKRKRQKFYTAVGTMGYSLGAESFSESAKGITKPIAESSLAQDTMADLSGVPKEQPSLSNPQVEATKELYDPRRRNRGGSGSNNFSSLTSGQFDSQPSLIG